LVDYEICFIRESGRVALIHVTACNDDIDAKAAAEKLMRPEFTKVEIWRGLECFP